MHFPGSPLRFSLQLKGIYLFCQLTYDSEDGCCNNEVKRGSEEPPSRWELKAQESGGHSTRDM